MQEPKQEYYFFALKLYIFESDLSQIRVSAVLVAPWGRIGRRGVDVEEADMPRTVPRVGHDHLVLDMLVRIYSIVWKTY